MVALRKTDMPTERYYTIDQIANLLGFHRNTVKKWISNGELAASKLGKEYRIHQTDLEDFMRWKQIKPKTAE